MRSSLRFAFGILCLCGLFMPVQAQQAGFPLRMWGDMKITGDVNQRVTKISAGFQATFALLNDSTVVGWGNNTANQLEIPIGLSRVIDISSFDKYCLVLKDDSTLVSWGAPNSGLDTIPSHIHKVIAIATGTDYALALRSDSTIVGWGVNFSGQTTIPSGLSGVVAIAAGYNHSLALKADGTVVAWGSNTYGQISVPVGLSGVIGIAAGGEFSLALKSNGTIIGWGNNSNNQIRVPPGLLGVTKIVSGPNHSLAIKSDSTVVALGQGVHGETRIPTGLSKVVSVAVGTNHSVAVKSDGTMVVWGDNYFGQSCIPKGFSNVVSIATGSNHFLALKADGSLVGWGNDESNQTTIPSGLSDIIAISAGGGFSLALKSDSTVVAWGDNTLGRTSIPQGLSGVIAIEAGGSHAIALKADSTVECWGYNLYGQATTPAGLRGVVSIAAGFNHSLALKSDGTVIGWGDNRSGQISIPANLSGVIGISAGSIHSLALNSNRTVTGWGDDSYGQVTPFVAPNEVASVEAGSTHSMAIKTDGTVVSWGDYGQRESTVPTGLSSVWDVSTKGAISIALLGTPPFNPGRSQIAQGETFASLNSDCIRDSSEHGINLLAIQVKPISFSARALYTFTNSDGRFSLPLYKGRYEITPVYRQDFLRQRQICPPLQAPYTINLIGTPRLPDTARNLNFAVEEKRCAKLEVSVSSNRRRRCFGNNITTVQFANAGLVEQAGVELHIKLPQYVQLKSASLPFTFTASDSVYHFALGALAPISQGQVVIRDSVQCLPNIRGLEVCTKAWLTPEADTCLWPTAYSGARIALEGYCRFYRPGFTIKNIGTGAMSSPRRLRLFADSQLVYDRPYGPLAAGDSLEISIPQGSLLQGRPLTLWAQQDTLSPFGEYATTGAYCLLSLPSPPPGTGAGLFPPRQSHSVEASDCQPIRDSYDPNDKQASPIGQGVQHHIEPGTLLSYRIRFMNKGNDTAYTVRVVDTLSNDLDLSTFEAGPVSHGSLSLSLSGEGRPVMSWMSRTIKLADSARSGTEAASGFISFSIRLRDGIAPGTVVSNRAHIYFDFNPAVLTNSVRRTLYIPAPPSGSGPGDSLIITSVERQVASATCPRLVPNPASKTLSLAGQQVETYLRLYDLTGRMALAQSLAPGQLATISHLAKGMYRWVAQPTDGAKPQSGSVIIQ